jgi:broad specificity phosphatase PhoE
MGTLVLIRHGQASFLADNYDQLSGLGMEQARRLGLYWKSTGTHYDRIYSGPAQRHAQTCEMVTDAAGASGAGVERLNEFDEYNAFGLLKAVMPRLVAEDAIARALQEDYAAEQEARLKARAFERLFQYVTRRWAAGEIEADGVEAWGEFCRRVARGIYKVVGESGPGSRVAVFTSGGPIAAAARLALDLSAVKTLELSWTSYNASYSEFLFSADRFSLLSFNRHPHLEGNGMLSWR